MRIPLNVHLAQENSTLLKPLRWIFERWCGADLDNFLPIIFINKNIKNLLLYSFIINYYKIYFKLNL